jgi:hypothetical protein
VITGQPTRARGVVAVTRRVAAMPRPASRSLLRQAHHAPFPQAAGLLARRVALDARGVAVRYLFTSADAAVAFLADRLVRDPALAILGPDLKAAAGPIRLVADVAMPAPVLVVGPPRCGGTALFDTLARHPALWSLGGESEGVIEGVPALHPAARGYDSHALGADDARDNGPAVRWGFLADLRNPRGTRWLDHDPATSAGGPRLLEKTPENVLRLPFLLRLFPDAYVVHLRRDPRDTIASMVRAWQHPGFVNIPVLPGWARGAWHLLLPEGWRGLDPDDLSRVAAYQWSAATEAILDIRSQRQASRWIEVEYDELRARPARTLRRLEAALHLPPRPAGQPDLPLSATTIAPPRRGNWRRTPGFNPAALHTVDATMRRFAHERTPMAGPTTRVRQQVRFACWLEDATSGQDTPTAADGVMLVDRTVTLQASATIPLSLVRRARFRERFLPDHPILWIDDAATGSLRPFWIRPKDFWVIRALSPGEPVPAPVPDRLRAALAGAGALVPSRERRAAAAHQAQAAAAEALGATDLCMLDGMLHEAHRRALADYYERLIDTGSWPMGDDQVAGRYGWHNEPLSRFFHHQLTALVSRVAGRRVRPSYSYVSAYRGGAVLGRHLDREQCDYTVSLLLAESGPGVAGGWPLHFDTRDGTMTVTQRPGQAVLFRGTRVPHYRPPLPDHSTHTSLLFHYVPAEFRRTLY